LTLNPFDDIVPLVIEPYDLIMLPAAGRSQSLRGLLGWLRSDEARAALARFSGYDFSHSGGTHIVF
jgi:hypothetical protein